MMNMNSKSFSLEPFSPTGPLPYSITGQLARKADTLVVRYALRGPMAGLVIAPPADLPARRHGLWEETCLEFFLAPKDSPRYWEFNLSPAGHWNVYRFQAYRQGMAEEAAFASLPFRVQRRRDSLVLHLELDLGRIFPAGRRLEAAIAAVIKAREGQVTYWALAHPGSRPDFHRRDGFVIEL